MFGHPRIYFGEFDRLSEKTQERENLISVVASIYRLTPQYANEVYREWNMSRQRRAATAAWERAGTCIRFPDRSRSTGQRQVQRL